jgi:CDP-diacylglycerol--glycerol-3-phosphate 3-phosphatidyltransferase
MSGLYVFKPWYADRLTGLREGLVRRRVSPNAITVVGVAFAAIAGAVLWSGAPRPVVAVLVFVLLAARLACANLDGGVARAAGRRTRTGVVANELGDRLAEYAALAGTLALAPLWLVAVAALAGTLPSWVALAGASAGASRVQGGPVGKTERCALIVLIAATGWAAPILVLFAAGSLLTAGVRLRHIRRDLAVTS